MLAPSSLLGKARFANHHVQITSGTLNATEVAEINAYCKDLIDTWFNEKGLFVVRHDRQSAGDKFYIYLLCPDTEATSKGGMWMKYQRD